MAFLDLPLLLEEEVAVEEEEFKVLLEEDLQLLLEVVDMFIVEDMAMGDTDMEGTDMEGMDMEENRQRINDIENINFLNLNI